MVVGPYSFAAWSAADIAKFEMHYDLALAKSDVGREAKLVGDFDVMKGLMIKHAAAEIRTLPPHLVGINNDNRDNKLMSAGEMSTKGSKIVKVGASRDLCGPLRAWCVQDTESRTFYKWTVKTAGMSDNFAVPSDSIEYGSVGCSHWNQFLCAVNQRRPTNIESLKGKDGNIDKAKIFAEDETFASLAETGLDWYVIKRGFVERFPQVPRIFSKALNAEHNIAIGETWDQQMSSVCSTAQLLLKGDDIPWKQVQKQIAASQGPHIADLGTHVAFVRKYGGGLSLFHVTELLDYFNLKLPAGRKVSGQWIQSLANIPLTTDFAIPHLVHAVFKAHACCTEADCDSSLARYVSGPELKCLAAKNQALALQAEKVLSNLRNVFAQSAGAKTLEYGDVSVQIADVVLGKEKDKTIRDSSSCLCQELRRVRLSCCELVFAFASALARLLSGYRRQFGCHLRIG